MDGVHERTARINLMIVKYGSVTISGTDPSKPEVLVENFHFNGVDLFQGGDEAIRWAISVLQDRLGKYIGRERLSR